MGTAQPGEGRRDPDGGNTPCLVHTRPLFCSLRLHLLLLFSLPRSLGSSPPPPRTHPGAALVLRSPAKAPELIAPGQLSGDNTSWGHSGARDTARSPPREHGRGLSRARALRGEQMAICSSTMRGAARGQMGRRESRAVCVCVSPPRSRCHFTHPAPAAPINI